ncbi:MAG: sulfatase, partial [Fibrobacteres bacterium]|nr:sulfatase [Fibrobacterota bacterium]
MRSNVIIIHCHDLGDYLGIYDSSLNTPNIDTIGREGVVFNNHFATGTVCSPSRGSLTTGCYPHTHGLMGLVHRGWELNVDKCHPLPETLRKNGYQTALFGVQHEHWDPKRLGYDYVDPVHPHLSDKVADAFCSWLNERKQSSLPFFASVGIFEPHRFSINPSHFRREGVFAAVEDSRLRVRPSLPDIPEIRKDLADFYGAVEYVDKQVGTILENLKRSGLDKNSLIVFTTDHGASFIHSKGTLYDGGVKVAMLIKHPDLPKGIRVDSLSSHVDFVPTVLNILGIDSQNEVEGISQLPVITGNKGAGRDFVFAENNYTNSFDPGRMVRNAKWKYIRKGNRTSVFDNQIPEIELSIADFRKVKEVFDFYTSERSLEELYDLENDPGELTNLADDPNYIAVLSEM